MNATKPDQTGKVPPLGRKVSPVSVSNEKENERDLRKRSPLVVVETYSHEAYAKTQCECGLHVEKHSQEDGSTKEKNDFVRCNCTVRAKEHSRKDNICGEFNFDECPGMIDVKQQPHDVHVNIPETLVTRDKRQIQYVFSEL